jgi:predicted Zn-dependent protease
MGIQVVLSAMAVVLVFSGCATSTAPGAVGVGRTQLLMVPSAAVNEAAALNYIKQTGSATSSGKLNSDLQLTSRVKGVAKQVINEVGAFRPDAVSWGWEINVIQDPNKIQATCAPGGKIIVYSGIVTQLDLSDGELAAVLGHEVGHALREHTREQVSQAHLSAAIVQGIASSNSRYASSNAQLAKLASEFLVARPFSRHMETEADLIGLELMARAGYDPKDAANVWRKVQAKYGSGGSDFLSTHPSHENRINELESATTKVHALYESRTGNRFAKTSDDASASAPATLASASTSRNEPTATAPTSLALPTSKPSEAASKALLGATSSKSVEAVRDIGQHEHQVFDLARGRACTNPRPTFLKRTAGLESYSLACGSSEMLSVQCTLGVCNVIQ